MSKYLISQGKIFNYMVTMTVYIGGVKYSLINDVLCIISIQIIYAYCGHLIIDLTLLWELLLLNAKVCLLLLICANECT